MKLRVSNGELRTASCELRAGQAIKLLRVGRRAGDWARVGGVGQGSSNPNYTYLFWDMSENERIANLP